MVTLPAKLPCQFFPPIVHCFSSSFFLRKKPILHLCKGGRARGELYKDGKHRVLITRRMAKTNEEVSKSCILHELREILLSHHLPCFSSGATHLLAMQYETTRDVIVSDGYYLGRRKVRSQWMEKLPSLFSAST